MSKTIHNVVHITSVHPRYDTRIFYKECAALASHGYRVTLLVADGKGNEMRDGINILDVGLFQKRLQRIIRSPKRMWLEAKKLNADIYHIHDPELLPLAVKLRRNGKTVVFDAHEDVPKQILAKPYLGKLMKWIISQIFAKYEKWAARKLDAVVGATPFISEKFQKMGVCSVDVNNYPMIEAFKQTENKQFKTKKKVCYIGGLEYVRGTYEIVQAIGLTNPEMGLAIAGKFSQKDFEEKVKSEVSWSRVTDHGWLNRVEVSELLNNSLAGLVTLHPVINYLDALPVKMFEYMAAGIPVIASNFPQWERIIKDEKCGLCVDPLAPNDIARAIEYLAENPSVAAEMGKNGRLAVVNKYNWGVEEKKLLKLYRELSS